MQCAALSSESRVHCHSAEGLPIGGLDAGWHVWEIARDRRPEALYHWWDGALKTIDGMITQTSGWVEYGLATDYQRAVLVAGASEKGEVEAMAVGFISEPRWPLRGFRRIRFPAYPSTRGDDGYLQEAVEVCERVARQWRCMAVEFLSVGQPEEVSTVELPGYATRWDRLEYVLDLTCGEEALWEGLSRRHRRNIKLSGNRDVRVLHTGTLESVRRVRQLQLEVTRRHAVKGDPFGLRPPEAYDALHRALVFPGLGRVYCAYVNGQVVSAALYLTFGQRARWLYSGSDELGLSTRASLAVIWEAIVDLRREGFRELSLGTGNREIQSQDSSHPAYGLHEFKLGFGARTRRVAAASKTLRPVAVRVHRALQRVRSCVSNGRRRASPARAEVDQ